MPSDSIRSPNPAGAMKDSRRKPENDRSGTAPCRPRSFGERLGRGGLGFKVNLCICLATPGPSAPSNRRDNAAAVFATDIPSRSCRMTMSISGSNGKGPMPEMYHLVRLSLHRCNRRALQTVFWDSGLLRGGFPAMGL